MRQFFFVSLLIVSVVATIGYFAWSLIATLYRDWQMGKDVNKIKAESETRRGKRQEEAARRLDNGCDHRFGEAFAGFPPDACYKCGLSENAPSGRATMSGSRPRRRSRAATARNAARSTSLHVSAWSDSRRSRVRGSAGMTSDDQSCTSSSTSASSDKSLTSAGASGSSSTVRTCLSS